MIPEEALRRIIVDGFRQIRKDPRVVEVIFRHLPQDQVSAIKKFILESPIDFSINYPRADVKVPSLALVLKNESEAQTFLSNIMSVSPGFDTPDQELVYDTLGGHGASVSGLSGLPKKIIGPLAVDFATNGSLTFADSALDEWEEKFNEFIEARTLPSMKLYVVKGAGVGQVYDIRSISNSGLDIEGTFEVNLDSSTLVDIREADNPTATDSEPSRSFSPDDVAFRVGAQYGVAYYLHIMARNPEETIYLFQFLKALFLVNTKELESQGIINLKISGTDLAPRSDYLPNDVFTRIMNLEFTYPFYTIVSPETVKTLSVTLTPYDSRVFEPGETQILAEIDLDED